MQLQRQSNIELLRILAIIMVVTEHFIRQSSLLASATEANGIINAFLVGISVFITASLLDIPRAKLFAAIEGQIAKGHVK